MAESLKNKTLKGLSWNFADTAVNQILRFVIGLVLARMLMPRDYGLIGIALIFVSIFEQIVDGGFTNALIQKKVPSEKDYGTAFFCNLTISIFLYLILFIFAPLIADFFDEEQLVLIIRVISTIILIDAFMFVQKAKYTKLMDFKVLAKASVGSSIISGIIGILMAYMNFGVWALVFQQMTRHFFNTIIMWFTSKGFVFTFSKESFKTLFSFGSKLMMSDLLDSVYKQIYQIVIGKVYNSTTLGLYTRAFQFSSLFSVTLSQMLQRVSYPALSALQDDKDRLLQSYRMLVKSAMFVAFPCMFCLAAVAKPMMIVLVGEKWLDAVPFLQILCFSMVLTPLMVINMNILKVKGRSDVYLYLEIAKKIIGFFPILVGIITRNIYMMLIGCVFENLIDYALNSYYSGKYVGYNVKTQVKDILPSFVLALFVSFVLYQMLQLNFVPFQLLILQLLVGIVLIIVVSEIMKIDAYLNIKTILTSLVHKKTDKPAN